MERITETLLTALRASGYSKLNTSDSFEGAVRRLVRRLDLQTGDAEFLLGMLRQMVWKMKIAVKWNAKHVQGFISAGTTCVDVRPN